MSSLAIEETDPKVLRQVLGRFASGVTVITTRGQDGVHGMTANAFMSGSLAPPLVVISVAHRARLHGLIEQSRVFGVSILGDAQESHSRHFSGQRPSALAPEFAFYDDIPVLDGALASIAASVEDAYLCGDHTLFTGRVRRISLRDGAPLLYFTGGYCRLGS